MKLEKKNITKKTKILLGVLLLTSFFLTISYLTTIVFGWVGPTQNPPYGNVSFKNSCENVFNEWCSGLGEVCYVVSEEGNGGTVVPECVPVKEDGSIDAPEFIPNVEGDDVFLSRISGGIGNLNSLTGVVLDIEKQMVEVCFGCLPFGTNPASLDGVSFYDGTPEVGMIVFKTPGTYSITPLKDDAVELLVVAGGGGGGAIASVGGTTDPGAGGGGGQVRHIASHILPTNEVAIIVGNGGGYASNGVDSKFDTITAAKGLCGNTPPGAGGASGNSYSGGSSYHIGNGYGGGGGGAGNAGNGSAGSYAVGGNGGTGTTILGIAYGGGGGGAARNWGSNGTMGSGVHGGGNGNSSGVANRGGGGGGLAVFGSGVVTGGSGIVIVRWGGYSKNYNPTTNAVW